MITGGAPISQQNFEFMEMVMGSPMFEIYGQTQNTGAAFIRILQDHKMGHVGGIIVIYFSNIVKFVIQAF